jgi:hypothetical protein
MASTNFNTLDLYCLLLLLLLLRIRSIALSLSATVYAGRRHPPVAYTEHSIPTYRNVLSARGTLFGVWVSLL